MALLRSYPGNSASEAATYRYLATTKLNKRSEHELIDALGPPCPIIAYELLAAGLLAHTAQWPQRKNEVQEAIALSALNDLMKPTHAVGTLVHARLLQEIQAQGSLQGEPLTIAINSALAARAKLQAFEIDAPAAELIRAFLPAQNALLAALVGAKKF